jgi:hypothetical protein
MQQNEAMPRQSGRGVGVWGMSRLNAAYVPNEIWMDFAEGRVHHFRYGEEASTAIYTDGHEIEFDSRVTEEEIAKEKAIWVQMMIEDGSMLAMPVQVKVEIERRNFHGVLSGWTA